MFLLSEVECLVRLRADVQKADLQGLSPVDIAAARCHAQVVHFLRLKRPRL